MARMVLHAPRTVQRKHGTLHTTLCGRMNSQSNDGMNIAAAQGEVTCKICLAKLEQIQREREAEANEVVRCEIWRDGEWVAGITGKHDYVLEMIEMHERANDFAPAIAYRRERDGSLVKIRDLGHSVGATRFH